MLHLESVKKIKSALKKDLFDYQKIWLENRESLSRSIIIYIMNFLTSEKILKKFQAASVRSTKKRFAMLEEIKQALDQSLFI